MMGHTPGPWEALLLDDQSDSTEIDPIDFCYCGDYVNQPASYEAQAEIHANARLMAAAPVMFEALKKIYIYYSRFDNMLDSEYKTMMIARDALREVDDGGHNDVSGR